MSIERTRGSRLADRTIVVTGGAHGIGRAYCHRLAAEAAAVVVADIDGPAAASVARTIRQQGGRALDAALDVTDLEAGTWYACRAVAPHLRARGGGSIVNIGSGTFFNGSPTRIHYVASKGAIIGFTRTLARELGPDGIRVNTLVPGSTLSEESPLPRVVEMRERQASARAFPRLEQPEDLTGTAVYLLSDDSAFVTGQAIVVEGGGILH